MTASQARPGLLDPKRMLVSVAIEVATGLALIVRPSLIIRLLLAM